MSHNTLFSEYKLGSTTLKNRVVMAPMTRSRAIDNKPNELHVEHYTQRAGAGLIITEGTSPSPNGLGYPRIPGLFNHEQVAAWKKVTEAVHAKGARIFVQLMHTGRVSHPANLPDGAKHIGPSAIAVDGEMYTDSAGPQPFPVPQEMTADDIETAINEYVTSSKLAIEAGFDGVELHAANGYLMEQFLSPSANQRNDAFGGTPDKRNHFVIETAKRVVAAIGKDHVGIRLSPYGAFNSIVPFEGITEQYVALSKALGEIGLTYIHIVDHSSMGTPEVPWETKRAMRDAFGGTLILSGGYDADRAEADLVEGKGHLVAFGRPFISNPDLVDRMKHGKELAAPEFNTFYTPGPAGYTDYPTA
ncbi:MAG: alkene reductase [bacterium]